MAAEKRVRSRRVRPHDFAALAERNGFAQPSLARGCAANSAFHRIRDFCFWPLIAVSLFASGQLAYADWPQILGPNRDGEAVGQTLPSALPDPIDVAWTVNVGDGYAGPVVAGDRVWLFHRVGQSERLESFDASTGRPIYRRDFDANYRGGVDADLGPRCAPVVAGDRLILFGAAGALHVVSREDGRPIWSRDLYGEFAGNEGYFGAGSTPIVMDDRIVVNVGGRKTAGIVALDLATGKTLWQASDAAASYSSPIGLNQNGEARVFLVARLSALLVNPTSGAIIAERPFGQRGPTVNAATPLILGNRAFLTSSYGVGAALVDLGSKQLRAVWENDTSLSSQYNTPVHRDGYLYGIHGREDAGPAELRCVELDSGRVVWTEANFGVAHAILAGERLLFLKTDGTLVLASATPEEYQPLAITRIESSGKTRALPAFNDGRLFLRDAKQLIGINVSSNPSAAR